MPKRVKWLLAVIVGLVALFAAACVMLYLPGVQKALVVSWVERSDYGSVVIGHFHAGIGRLEVRDLRWQDGDTKVRAGRLEADFRPLQLLRGRVMVGRVAVTEVETEIRLSGETEPDAVAVGFILPDLLRMFAWPDAVRVGEVLLEGSVTVHALDPAASGRAEFSLEGRNFRVGEEAGVSVRGRWIPRDPDAGGAGVACSLETVARFGDDGAMELLRTEVFLHPTEGGFRREQALRLFVEAASDHVFDRVVVEVGLRDWDRVYSLFAADLTVRPQAGYVEGIWRASVERSQLAAYLPTVLLPEFDIEGSGAFSWQGSDRPAEFQADFQGRLDQLGVLRPELEPVGRIGVRLRADLEWEPGFVDFKEFDLQLTDREGTEVAVVRLNRAARVPVGVGEVSMEGQDLVDIRLTELPSAWMDPWIPFGTLESGAVSGAWRVSLRGRGLEVRSTEPTTLGELVWRDEEWGLLPGITGKFTADGDWADGAFSADLRDLDLVSEGGDVLRGRAHVASAGEETYEFRAEFSIGLPTLVQRMSLPVGVDGALRIEGRQDADGLHLATLAASWSDPSGRGAAALNLSQGIRIIPDVLLPEPSDPARPIAAVTLTELPLAALNSWLEEGQELGGHVSGELSIGLNGENIELKFVEPLRGDELFARTGDDVWLRGGALRIEGSVRTDLAGGSFDFPVFRLAGGRGVMWEGSLAGSVEDWNEAGDQLDLRMRGTADLPAWKVLAAADPWLSRVEAGSLRADLHLRPGVADMVAGEIVVDGLRATDLRAPSTARLGVTVRREAEETFSLALPVELTGDDGASQFELDGRISREGEGYGMEVSVKGSRLVVDDLLGLAQLPGTAAVDPAPAAAAEAAAEAAAVVAEAARAFWHPLHSGMARMEVENLVYGDHRVSRFTARLAAAPDALSLEAMQGRLGSSPFSITGSIDYREGRARPYGLKGNVVMEQFDAGAYFQEANPRQRPVLEGQFSLRGAFEGEGTDPADLAQRLRGDFNVNSGSGVFRGLAQRAQAASVVTGLLGAIAQARELTAVSRLAGSLAEIRFDEMRFRAVRGADLHVALEEVALLAPEIRMRGRGRLEFREDVPLANQPLAAEFNLESKGQIASMLRELGLLAPEPDADEFYRLMRPVRLGGTPANIDANDFWALLARAGATGIDRILGR